MHEQHVHHRRLVDDDQVAFERMVLVFPKAAAPGVNLEQPVDRFASRPVASPRCLAARPVGAQSSTRAPFAARMRRIAVMIVVLPTPGPPVTTRTFETS